MEEQGRETLHAALAERLSDDGSVVTEQYAAQTGTNVVTVTVMAECLEEIGVEVPISQEQLREIQVENIPREEAVND